MDDSQRQLLAEAWRYIPSDRSEHGAGAFTRTRIDRMIALLIGLAGIVSGAQALAAALSAESASQGWDVAVSAVGFGSLLVMIVACVFNVLTVPAATGFAVIYPVLLLAWPLTMTQTALPPAESQWQFYLINVAGAAAVVAFRLGWQFAWAIGVPLVYGAVRLVGAGGDPAAWAPTAFEVSFALLLGGALVALAWALRSAASHVDAVRARAVASYAKAAAADAAENERVAVAALMHDSVLGALLAAERAQTDRERTLAVSMAREAMAGLAAADTDDGEVRDEPMSAEQIAVAIERAAGEIGVSLTITRRGHLDTTYSGRVAQVVVLASMQAIANAVQHAEAVGLRVTLTAQASPDGIRVVVSDTGPGFDPAAVPEDRLGVRGSIIARATSVGGHASVESGSEGTVVTIEWESGDRW